ncbi:MAG: molybdopterin-dependent oxidoreductase [Sulfurimonas sp.]|jgi:anaerobic selenocysteine-containing dehydrogenase|nr:molybdopterin-dependent oxidoreductase [Sulfurimonas sp.]MBU3939808.1 molybdopterin-dependent oxidoreductase [bacterium]MBU4025686.1 molybdopterin-dependent oxidoreductase [bacterium]MBU4059694.1 molybdopterin-dependent oxidoreductase [bacterium]MBU4110774.1 molybdopterin-dependent oxidoreductase [bacterium]
MYLQSRRTFLKGAAFTVAGAAIAKGVFTTDVLAESVEQSKFTNTPDSLSFYPPMEEWNDFKELDGDDWKRGGIDRKGVRSESNPDGIEVNDYMIVPTACSNCEASCGITAWIDKKSFTVKKYMGNPLHPASRGRNCAKGYASQSQMYDPDRIAFPLKRAPGSARGEGKWIRTTWDEAMTTIGKKMADTIEKGDELSKKSVMFHVGRPNENGFVPKIWHTLGLDAYNSHTNICSSGGRTPTIQWANDDRTSPDWANAKLVFLNSSHAADAGHYFQQSASFIADARAKGAKLVVMDPRMSNSAGMADLWIAAWPGTEPVIYLYLAQRMLQEGKVNKAFVKKWLNWEVMLDNKKYLEFMVEKGYLSKVPAGNDFNAFMDLLKELYAPYTLDYAVKETHVPAYKLEALYDMFIWAGTSISTYFWRAAAAGNRGGWMSGRTGYLSLALRGAIGPEGGTFFHHWHVISVAGKGGSATVGQGPRGADIPKVDVYNELTWPPEWPLSTYEMSYLLPHLLSDKEWQDKWRAKGLSVPQKLSVYIPRMYNPVWINPDGFRWIETLKDESKMELTMNLSPVWSETNWYMDYILPVGLAGERHDQHSEATMPARWTSFRQPVMRVALEKAGWKPKNPNRATLEAHIKAGLGEVWEDNEFWFDLCVNYIDPTGKLGIKKMWQSKKDPSRPVTISEWYDAAFGDNLPNLKATATADERYKNSEFPVYEYMRDHGAWMEENNIYSAQERELKDDGENYISHGHKYPKHEVSTNKRTGVMSVEHHGKKTSIGIEIDGVKMEGFATLDKKLDFFCEWLADDWKWPEYAIPFYPRSEEEKKSMTHIVSHVNHSFMTEKNSYALNTVFRLPYNIHTRSANSKHLMEISQNHDPIWISTPDAARQGFKRGDAIRVNIVDSLTGLASGYFVAMAVPTEGVLPGTLACSHHGGRWKLVNSVTIPNGITDGKVDSQPVARNMNDPKFMAHSPENAGQEGAQIKIEDYSGTSGINSFGVPTAELQMDGKEGKLKYVNGIHPFHAERFADYNRDSGNIWWDGLSGSWQNSVAAPHPDPISGMHCWHQKVILEPAQPGDKIGDIYANYENNFKVYQGWRDQLTRGLDDNSTKRRPQHIKRPWVPLSDKAYAVNFK